IKMSLRMRAASRSLTSACRSPTERLLVSTRRGVGAKRAAIFWSCSRDGGAVFFCAMAVWFDHPISTTRMQQPNAFKVFTSGELGRVGSRAKPIIITGAAGSSPVVGVQSGRSTIRQVWVQAHSRLQVFAEGMPMNKWFLALAWTSLVALPALLRADNVV